MGISELHCLETLKHIGRLCEKIRADWEQARNNIEQAAMEREQRWKKWQEEFDARVEQRYALRVELRERDQIVRHVRTLFVTGPANNGYEQFVEGMDILFDGGEETSIGELMLYPGRIEVNQNDEVGDAHQLFDKLLDDQVLPKTNSIKNTLSKMKVISRPLGFNGYPLDIPYDGDVAFPTGIGTLFIIHEYYGKCGGVGKSLNGKWGNGIDVQNEGPGVITCLYYGSKESKRGTTILLDDDQVLGRVKKNVVNQSGYQWELEIPGELIKSFITSSYPNYEQYFFELKMEDGNALTNFIALLKELGSEVSRRVHSSLWLLDGYGRWNLKIRDEEPTGSGKVTTTHEYYYWYRNTPYSNSILSGVCGCCRSCMKNLDELLTHEIPLDICDVLARWDINWGFILICEYNMKMQILILTGDVTVGWKSCLYSTTTLILIDGGTIMFKKMEGPYLGRMETVLPKVRKIIFAVEFLNLLHYVRGQLRPSNLLDIQGGHCQLIGVVQAWSGYPEKASKGWKEEAESQFQYREVKIAQTHEYRTYVPEQKNCWLIKLLEHVATRSSPETYEKGELNDIKGIMDRHMQSEAMENHMTVWFVLISSELKWARGKRYMLTLVAEVFLWCRITLAAYRQNWCITELLKSFLQMIWKPGLENFQVQYGSCKSEQGYQNCNLEVKVGFKEGEKFTQNVSGQKDSRKESQQWGNELEKDIELWVLVGSVATLDSSSRSKIIQARIKNTRATMSAYMRDSSLIILLQENQQGIAIVHIRYGSVKSCGGFQSYNLGVDVSFKQFEELSTKEAVKLGNGHQVQLAEALGLLAGIDDKEFWVRPNQYIYGATSEVTARATARVSWEELLNYGRDDDSMEGLSIEQFKIQETENKSNLVILVSTFSTVTKGISMNTTTRQDLAQLVLNYKQISAYEGSEQNSDTGCSGSLAMNILELQIGKWNLWGLRMEPPWPPDIFQQLEGLYGLYFSCFGSYIRLLLISYGGKQGYARQKIETDNLYCCAYASMDETTQRAGRASKADVIYAGKQWDLAQLLHSGGIGKMLSNSNFNSIFQYHHCEWSSLQRVSEHYDPVVTVYMAIWGGKIELHVCKCKEAMYWLSGCLYKNPAKGCINIQVVSFHKKQAWGCINIQAGSCHLRINWLGASLLQDLMILDEDDYGCRVIEENLKLSPLRCRHEISGGSECETSHDFDHVHTKGLARWILETKSTEGQRDGFMTGERLQNTSLRTSFSKEGGLSGYQMKAIEEEDLNGVVLGNLCPRRNGAVLSVDPYLQEPYAKHVISASTWCRAGSTLSLPEARWSQKNCGDRELVVRAREAS